MGWTPTGAGTDADAIHDNVAAEISAIAEKVTPVNADLVVIEDSAAANAKKRVQVGNLPGGGGSPDPYGHFPSPAGTYDDEFIDRAIAGAWTTITTSGSQTITEDLGRLSVKYDDQTSGDMNGVLKAMTLNTGDYIRTGLSQMVAATAADNFDIGGLWFTDGVIASSNMIALVVYTGSARFSILEGTITSWAEVSASTFDRTMPLGDIHIELEYGASNSFDARIGPDGVSFLDNVLANAFTVTPTHGGVCWTTQGGSDPKVVSFDYFRSNA